MMMTMNMAFDDDDDDDEDVMEWRDGRMNGEVCPKDRRVLRLTEVTKAVRRGDYSVAGIFLLWVQAE